MKFYFINSDINPDTIYGDQYPTCLSEIEVRRLSAEWGVDLFDQMHEASVKELAADIRESGDWDADKLAALCDLAGMTDEWNAADGDSFESVAYAAAEKLGVEI